MTIVAVAAGVVASSAGILIDRALAPFRDHGSISVVDDLVVGTIAAILAWVHIDRAGRMV